MSAGRTAGANSNGVTVTLTWDALNRLSSVIDNRLPSGADTATYVYDQAGNVVTSTYPNGFQTTFTYDQLRRLTGLTTPVSSYTYQLGPVGNRISASEGNGRAIQWNYDGIYRLTQETISGDPESNNGTATYALDPVGNRVGVTSGLTTVTTGSWNFNSDDELLTETFDANGNTVATGGKSFTYDSQNHMTSMTAPGLLVTMLYDAFGNRVQKTVNGVTTQYLVEDDVNPTGLPQVLEEIVSGVVSRTYTYGLQRISEDQIVNNQWTTSFYGYDGGGNVRQLTDSSGVVTDQYEYDAYGNAFTKQGTTPNVYLYRGEQYDFDLSLYYLRARYYNQLNGRFVSRDPEDGIDTDPKTLHKYMYAGGDPVNSHDPTGRNPSAATMPGFFGTDMIEYGFLIGAIALEAKPAAQIILKTGECVFNYAASAVDAAAENKLIVGVDAPECKVEAVCKPCQPVQAGEYGYDLHIGQKSDHFDKASKTWIPGGQIHWHLYICTQAPPSAGCICSWSKLRDITGVGTTPLGVDKNKNACAN